MYWVFLDRNRDQFRDNRRMGLVLKNLEWMTKNELVELTSSVNANREKWGVGSIDR
jgi:deoxyribodipyrimidine photolyase-like uncharacterized protein